ncbi:helix-turn-helix transcriptional regulator [Luteibacter sp. 621]|uniref:helix-turn-helix transcriptional regulator n=1 Tax=Luteibacter sp. 621 TaxID=3373916 RepID=UPI003D229D7B
MAAHLDESLGPADLARVAGLSVNHFHRAFKATFGLTPYAYVLDARLRHAASLLERTHLPLRDIAAAGGFFDQAHLANTFRRLHGMSPSRWRRVHGDPDGPGLAEIPHSPSPDAVTLPPLQVAPLVV